MNRSPNALQSRLAALPAVHLLQRHPSVQPLAAAYPTAKIVAAIRAVLQEARQTIRDDPTNTVIFESETLAEEVIGRLDRDRNPGYRPVINGSGILFHPDTGEIPLQDPVYSPSAPGLTTIIFDDAAQVEQHISRLTEAEDALIIASAPAAFFLAMKVFGDGKEIVVARSQLGMRENGFRPLDALGHAGARIIEVGATNKTHAADYQAALGTQTGAIAVIRPTTYALRGFTQEVPLQTLVRLGDAAEVPVVYDAGYTTLRPISGGIWRPTLSVTEAVRYGAAATIVRGDGLIGGPACGLIIGRRAAVDKIRRHPLMPLLLPTPSVRAALNASVSELTAATDDFDGHPAAFMLTASHKAVRQRADTLRASLKTGENAEVISHTAYLTPYRLPADSLPSYALSFRARQDDPEKILTQWRNCSPALLGIPDGDRILIDTRGIRDEQIGLVAQIMSDL